MVVESSEAEKVAALRRTETHDGAAVEVIETHMSWVFLAGRSVYKMKKPVKTGVLDFSTLELRHFYCNEEVRLNRRLTSGVYLGVVPLTKDKAFCLRKAGRVVEWLVWQQRLNEQRSLHHLLRSGALTTRDIKTLAAHLAAFYKAAAPVPFAPQAYVDRLRLWLAENVAGLCLPPLEMPEARVRAVGADLARFLQLEAALFGDRATKRRMVEAHGDLRPEHIFFDEPLQIIDCLEFSRELRCLDPLDELAYLGLECAALGTETVGTSIIEYYEQYADDPASAQLMTYYAAARALLRARLAIWHNLKPLAAAPHWRAQALAYLERAERLTGAL